MRVLIVEDERKLARLLRRALTAHGLSADIAESGEDARWMADATPYAALLVDVMLPGIDGVELCRQLRAEGNQTPILMLTARDAIEDRVTALDSGADDYVVKPFALAELLARVRALARRPSGEREPVLQRGSLRLDPATRQVWRNRALLNLTAKEFSLLETLMRHDGVVSRLDLLNSAWDDTYENRSNIVDVYIGYLREKIDRPFGTTSIETVRGVGYRLQNDAAVSQADEGGDVSVPG